VSLQSTHLVVAKNLDKTGFSLTAGSYTVRASSSQSVDVAIGGGLTSATAAIAAVTLTRAHALFGGSVDASDATHNQMIGRGYISATNLYTAVRFNSTGTTTVSAHVVETF
jgi:hypothetical protein